MLVTECEQESQIMSSDDANNLKFAAGLFLFVALAHVPLALWSLMTLDMWGLLSRLIVFVGCLWIVRRIRRRIRAASNNEGD